MIELMLLTYGAIVFCLFRFLKVPVNTWTVTTSILVGALGISWLLILMNYFHPYTGEARFYQYTTPIIPTVRGPVVEVPVTPNVLLKQGDVLFTIDPRPYEYKVAQLKAERKRAEADRDFSKRELDRSTRLARQGAAAEREVRTWEERYERARAEIDKLSSALLEAEYDLDQTVVRAPTAGRVNQLFLRPGMMAVPLPLRPVMVFVHEEQKPFVAAFPQNAVQNIQPDFDAEVTFAAIPGTIFRGKVIRVLDATAAGQLQPTGNLLDPQSQPSPGHVLVGIRFTEDQRPYELPGGTTGLVAVYSHRGHALSIIRKILLRMKAWENYVFLG